MGGMKKWRKIENNKTTINYNHFIITECQTQTKPKI